jgi:hypothetical protein
MINKLGIKNDVEKGGSVLIYGTIPAFTLKDGERSQTLESKQVCLRAEI